MNEPLTTKAIADLAVLGIKVDVLVDCSHAQNVRTIRQDRPERSIIMKPIELDCTLKPAAGFDADKAVAAMNSAPAQSFLSKLHSKCNGFMVEGSPSHRIKALSSRVLKVEFPRFDGSILNLVSPDYSIRDAVTACRALNAVAFMALSEDVRRSMGMYRRKETGTFELNGTKEPEARIVAP